ncbi:MAG TPA: MFS transporter [Acidimicrobiia bacterium]|nr:MFS transporter [Acidimicrobiia bacterium]
MSAEPTVGGTRRSVGAFLGATLSSSAAALALDTVIGKQVFDLTGRELDLGLIGLTVFAPNFVLVLVTGSLADRFDRRRIAAMGLTAEAIAVGALAWYASTGPTASAPIFLLTLAFGTARAFATPATRALPPDIVVPERLPWLTVRYSGTWQTAAIIGPILGGFLYAVAVWLPYLVVAVLLVVAAALLLSVEVRPDVRVGRRDPLVEPRTDAEVRADALLEAGVEATEGEAAAAMPRGRLHEAMEGLRFIRRQPALLGAISLDLFAVLFGGAVALLPAIADDLGVGAVGLGWLRAATGIGAALMTLTLAWRPVRRHVGVTLLAAVAVFGLFTIVLGVTGSFAVAFVSLMVLSGADAISVFIRGTLVPLITPEDKRGRVFAVEMVFIGASNELGGFESGAVGQLIGVTGAVVLGGAATLLVATGWWWLFPSLRKVDRFPGLAAPDGAPAETSGSGSARSDPEGSRR